MISPPSSYSRNKVSYVHHQMAKVSNNRVSSPSLSYRGQVSSTSSSSSSTFFIYYFPQGMYLLLIYICPLHLHHTPGTAIHKHSHLLTHSLTSSSSPPHQATMADGGGSKIEIKVMSQPDEATLTKMGVRDWPTWGCGVSKFPWAYDSAETW